MRPIRPSAPGTRSQNPERKTAYTGIADGRRRREAGHRGDDPQTPGGQGPITVLIKEHELLVTNSLGTDEVGRPASGPDSSSGHGLGLGIVQRLCECNGWAFALHADEARVSARLSW